MNHVTITRYNRLLQIPAGLHIALLCPELEYLHRSQLRIPGQGTRWQTKTVKLYAKTPDGGIQCPCGLYNRILTKLTHSGYVPVLNDTRPNHLKNFPAPDWCNIGGLRPGQHDLLTTIASEDMGVIKAPTGFGKGVMIERVCQMWPTQNQLISTYSKAVATQLYQRLLKVFPNAGCWNSDIHKKGNPQVCTTGSLGHMELDKFDIVQWDEVHQLATKSVLQYMGSFNGCKFISYSASPDDRLDNTALLVEAFFGPRIYTLDYDEAVSLGLVSPIEVLWIDWDTAQSDYIAKRKSDVTRQRYAYWQNTARNNIIRRAIIEVLPLYISDPDPQILVLTDKTDHCIRLSSVLPGFVSAYGSMTERVKKSLVHDRLIDTPLTKKELMSMQSEFSKGNIKRAVATGVWGTGVDVPNLSVVVRADGGASPIKDIQLPGRVARKVDGKPIGLLVDFADPFDVWAARRARARLQSYKKMGWNITTIPLKDSL